MRHPLLFDWLKGSRDTFHAKFFAGEGVKSSKHHHQLAKGERAWESEMGRYVWLKKLIERKKLSMFRFSVTYPQRCYLDSSYSLQILFPPFSQFPTLRSRSVYSNSQLTLYLAGGDLVRQQTYRIPGILTQSGTVNPVGGISRETFHFEECSMVVFVLVWQNRERKKINVIITV